jgi:predicted secreted Zn-dependent protease
MTHAVLALSLILSQGPDPAVSESVEYYAVSGATATELRSSIDTNRPRGKSRIGDGRTAWHVSWQYQYAMHDQCAVTGVRTAGRHQDVPSTVGVQVRRLP